MLTVACMTLIRKLLAVPIAILAVVLLTPSFVFAQDGELPAPVVVEDAGSTFVLSPFLWKTITAIILPILIYLVTKRAGNPTFKVIFGFVVAAVDALIIRWTTLDGEFFFDQAALEDVFHVYAMQALVYFGMNKTSIATTPVLLPERGLG